MGTEVDRFILGSNPLFGADHLSSARARTRGDQMTLGRRLQIIREASQSGATGFTFTSDEAALSLLREMRQLDPTELGLYPLVPNSELIPKLLSKGAVRTAAEVLENLAWTKRTASILRGGWAYLTGNPTRAAMTFLESEVEKLRACIPQGSGIKSLLLHEHFTDLALGLELDQILAEYVDYVEESLGLTPGFETRNLVRMTGFLERSGLIDHRLVLMTPVNPCGFQMSPSRKDVEVAARRLQSQSVIAISVLAGGVISLDSAVDYLTSFPRLDSVAVGVSSPSQAKQTFQILQTRLGSRN